MNSSFEINQILIVTAYALHSLLFFFLSGSPFSKPTVFSARRNTSPYGSAATTSSSAFSSVVSPSTTRRTSSPSTVATASVGVSSSAGSELEKRSHGFADSSSLYPWLKSEGKDQSGERRGRKAKPGGGHRRRILPSKFWQATIPRR